MKQVVLAGNAVTADILSVYLRSDPRYMLVGTTADDEFTGKGGPADVPSIGISQLKGAFSPDDAVIIMAIGYDDLNRTRERIFHRLKGMGYTIETYIHPDARVYTEHPIGEGCVILPAVVEPHVEIRENTMVWCNVTLAHHCRIAENCWIASGAVVSGQASIARNAFVGVNATVVNEIEVGEFNIVGASALISKNTKANTVHLTRSGEQFRYSSEDYIRYFGV